jgi:hypothetical protein
MRIDSGSPRKYYLAPLWEKSLNSGPSASVQKKNTSKLGEGQVHPIARSGLPCDPNVNANRFWFTPKVLPCTFLKKTVSTPPLYFFRKLVSFSPALRLSGSPALRRAAMTGHRQPAVPQRALKWPLRAFLPALPFVKLFDEPQGQDTNRPRTAHPLFSNQLPLLWHYG